MHIIQIVLKKIQNRRSILTSGTKAARTSPAGVGWSSATGAARNGGLLVIPRVSHRETHGWSGLIWMLVMPRQSNYYTSVMLSPVNLLSIRI